MILKRLNRGLFFVIKLFAQKSHLTKYLSIVEYISIVLENKNIDKEDQHPPYL